MNLDDLFPIRRSQIYLNHAGCSPLPAPTAAAIAHFANRYRDAGTGSFFEWLPRIQRTRELAAAMMNCAPADVGFIKSTTQGLQAISWGLPWGAGDALIVEERPFPSNWYPWLWPKRCGADVRLWPERGFGYELDDLETLLRQGNVRAVSVCSANFGTGFVHDLAAVGALCREHGALFIVDGIQTLGAMPLDVQAAQVDFLCADSHKWLLGPEGCGIIYARPEAIARLGDHVVGWIGRRDFTSWDDLELPAEDSARRFEEGAPNYLGNQALGESLAILMEAGIDHVYARIRENCGVLEEGLRAMGWRVLGEGALRAGIVAADKPGTDPAVAAEKLWSQHNVNCNARRGFLRLAPHFYNSLEEMHRVLAAVRAVE